MTVETLTTFFGWMTVLNFGFLALAGGMLLVTRDWATNLHANMFDMEQADVKSAYFNWLATYKVLALVFAFVPWLALTLMG